MNKMGKFLELIMELPVIFAIDRHIVRDPDPNHIWWVGQGYDMCIDDYLIHNGRVFNKGFEDESEVLEAVYGSEKYDQMTCEERADAYEDLPWDKVIVIYIKA